MGATTAISKNTFREAIRQPVYWAVVLLTAVLMPLSVLFAGFALGEESRLVRDASLTSITIAGLLLAIFLSSSVVADEIEKKTAFTVLCKPVHRRQFVLGKYLGILSAIFVAYILLAVVLLLTIWWHEAASTHIALLRLYLSGAPVDANNLYAVTAERVFEPGIHGQPLPFSIFWREFSEYAGPVVPNMLKGSLLSFFEIAILTSAAVAFSTKVQMIFNVCLTFSLFVVGHQLQTILHVLSGGDPGTLTLIIQRILPNFEFLNYASDIAFDTIIPLAFVGQLAVYTIAWAAVFLLLAVALFDQREIA